eukprot:CAMPEP_0169085856 /NCGR_PEP_ID=MMETSP1015-20121227/13387_1 /TAXON_ID=342587 /ORGANISM="Karlodinium micrum, Strain CCMP2283" /LENGTH=264 /DNA_ID=CAMNT_0009145979 /DNA_START=164 /DNA_END=955 /DNA_ORIENTATION=+
MNYTTKNTVDDQDWAEELSTAAPSCRSDAETSCSSDGANSDSYADDEMQVLHMRRKTLAARMLRGRMEENECIYVSSTSKKRHGARFFRGTSLETIPGTPVGMSENPSFCLPPAFKVNSSEAASKVLQNSLDASRKPAISHSQKAFLATVPQISTPNIDAAPSSPKKRVRASRKPFLATVPNSIEPSVYGSLLSPKRRARASVLERARDSGLPLKVSASRGDMNFTSRTLDPTMPAKKKPLSSCDDIEMNVEPGVPMKKCVTPW